MYFLYWELFVLTWQSQKYSFAYTKATSFLVQYHNLVHRYFDNLSIVEHHCIIQLMIEFSLDTH